MFIGDLMLRFITFLAVFGLLGCASKTIDEECASTLEEPVSLCRANYVCRGGGSTFKKIVSAVAIGLGAGGASMTNSRNTAALQVDRCIQNDLSVQKANAGIPSTSLNCTTVEVDKGVFNTTCD